MTRALIKKRLGKYIRPILAYSDLIIVNILFAITSWICPEIHIPYKYRLIWVLANISYLPAALWFNSYHERRAILMDNVFLRALQVVGIHALFFLSLLTFLRVHELSPRIFIVFYGMMIVVLPLWWLISRYIIKKFRRKGYNFSRVVIVGTNATALRLVKEIMSDSGFGYKVMGFFDITPPENFGYKYLGNLDKLDEYVKANNVDEIFFTLAGDKEDVLREVVKVADNNIVRFYYVPQISRYISRSFELNNVGAVPVLSIRRNPLKSTYNRFVKRTFDIAFSSVVLLFSPIVFIPVAIAIKISSPGPIFFRQDRTGYRGRSFKCWKFRTMRVNANADSVQATSDDPRKTRVGDFLRRTSIDELPQFINVWLGDMSIVGPRPHMLKHTEDYSRLVDKYMVRHAVKPGITGWAQVNGYRGITDKLWKMERRVEFDVWYIENWSFLLDMKIVVRTVLNAVHGEENAF